MIGSKEAVLGWRWVDGWTVVGWQPHPCVGLTGLIYVYIHTHAPGIGRHVDAGFISFDTELETSGTF